MPIHPFVCSSTFSCSSVMESSKFREMSRTRYSAVLNFCQNIHSPPGYKHYFSHSSRFKDSNPVFAFIHSYLPKFLRRKCCVLSQQLKGTSEAILAATFYFQKTLYKTAWWTLTFCNVCENYVKIQNYNSYFPPQLLSKGAIADRHSWINLCRRAQSAQIPTAYLKWFFCTEDLKYQKKKNSNKWITVLRKHETKVACRYLELEYLFKYICNWMRKSPKSGLNILRIFWTGLPTAACQARGW